MSSTADIKKAIKGLSETGDEVYSILCTVKSVDLTAKTCYCLPVSGDADITDVSLIVNAQTGFMIIPTVESKVLVTMQNESTGYVGMYSQIDFIHLNGTNYGGLVIIDDLVTKLNNLEGAFNNFLSLYNLHTHAGVTSGAATTSPVVMPNNNTLTPTVVTDLENTTVLHGNGA